MIRSTVVSFLCEFFAVPCVLCVYCIPFAFFVALRPEHLGLRETTVVQIPSHKKHYLSSQTFYMFRLFKPVPELSHFISRIMVSRIAFGSGEARPTIPFPPQPEHCLYFYPHDPITSLNHANGIRETMPQSMLVGPQLSRVDITMGRNMLVVMVGFQPGGLHRLTRVPMHELLEQPVDARLLLGKEIGELTEQLFVEQDPIKMVDLVQAYFLKKLQKIKASLPVEQVLLNMLQQKDLLNVDQLAREAFVSVRQLERQCRERTGLPPKLFLRLVRFSRAWVMRETRPDISWLNIAHSCSYADQMHMIRDFREFAGLTPQVLQTQLERSALRLQGSTFNA